MKTIYILKLSGTARQVFLQLAVMARLAGKMTISEMGRLQEVYRGVS